MTACTDADPFEPDPPAASCSFVSTTAETDPGAATVETTEAGAPLAGRYTTTPGVIATGTAGLIDPVDDDGLVTPTPFKKLLTTDPKGAGFAQLFADPSAL